MRVLRSWRNIAIAQVIRTDAPRQVLRVTGTVMLTCYRQ